MTGRTKIGFAVAAIVIVAGISTWAQGLGPSASGSLSELTSEVRQLRVAIQDAARGQNQMQALNISLTAQHSRLTQVSSRLDASNEELQKASAKTQAATKGLLEIQSMAGGATTAQDRAGYDAMMKQMRYQVDVATEEENQIRTRQSDLLNAFRMEETRWRELVAKLEEILKK